MKQVLKLVKLFLKRVYTSEKNYDIISSYDKFTLNGETLWKKLQ